MAGGGSNQGFKTSLVEREDVLAKSTLGGGGGGGEVQARETVGDSYECVLLDLLGAKFTEMDEHVTMVIISTAEPHEMLHKTWMCH